MGSILEATILHHVCIVLVFLWFLDYFHYSHPIAYFLSFIYLYLVHEGYVTKLTKKLQFEEKRESNQRRILTDSETVRWLNHALEKMWLVCMEDIVSQKILLPIIPWFLDKYKPWTVKHVEVQHLYLGRSPPIFTEMRVLPSTNGDDHLVMELGMNFRTADDMSVILGAKLRKRLGFGMWAKLHMLGLHIEGKVLVGVKFLPKWPFIGRLRVCFTVPPYVQMTVKPIFTHGLDVTEVPGIAGWIDNLLALVFEQTLVEPNMLVVDVEKFVSPKPEKWFSVDAKELIAHAVVEVLEAADMNPSDLNGLADPYVKGQLGPYRFRTKTQKKTLTPKWREEFKIPICTWESENILAIEVRDKDHLYDDAMGGCSVNINELRGGQRHDIWLPLQKIKTGRLHLAVTVLEVNGKGAEPSRDAEIPDTNDKNISFAADSVNKGSFSSLSSEKSPKSPKVADRFEPIDVEGQSETGIWIHHPGSEVQQVWEPRKGRTKRQDSQQLDGHIQRGGDLVENLKSTEPTSGRTDGSSTDESVDDNKPHSGNRVRQGLRKIGSLFHRSPRAEEKSNFSKELEPSPRDNIRASNTKEAGVRLIVDNTTAPSSSKNPKEDEVCEENGTESPQKGHVKDVAKSIFKHAGKSARSFKHVLSAKGSRKSKADKDGSLEQNSSDDESFISAETPLAQTGSGSAVSATRSGDNSLKATDDTVKNGVGSGNNSFKSGDTAIKSPKDSSIQTTSVSSMQSTIDHGVGSGNNSFKSEDTTIKTPKDSSIQTTSVGGMQSTIDHGGSGSEQVTKPHSEASTTTT